MKKKGFTLIELLAVIVILAVIALILVPVISKVIDDARYGTAKTSVSEYVHSVDQLTALQMGGLSELSEFTIPSDNIIQTGDEELEQIKYNGQGPTYVYMEFDEDKTHLTYGEFCQNGYSINYIDGMGVVESDDEYCKELEPGLYAKNGDFTSWDELVSLGLDIEKDYTTPSYNSETSTYTYAVGSPSQVLKDNNLKGRLVLPNTITRIGGNAFNRNDNITSIRIPNSVKSIGYYAFAYSKLENIVIPGTVEEIENFAFYNVTTANKIVLRNGIKSIGMSAFATSGNDIECITIPSSVETFGYSAFSDVQSKKIIFGEGITVISKEILAHQNSAYEPKIETVVLGSKVTTIENQAFSKQSNLKNINFPNSLKSVGSYGLYMTGLTEITLPDGIEEMKEFSFAYMDNLVKAYVPGSIVTIEGGNFMNNPLLSNVILGEGLETIGPSMFAYCPSLKNITLPSTLKTITASAFSSSGLESIDIPNGVTSIGGNAFNNNTSLVSVNIPGSVKTIGNNAFRYTYALETLTLGEGIETIGESAFSTKNTNPSPLKNVVIPSTVTSMGAAPFNNRTNLETVTFTDTVGWKKDGTSIDVSNSSTNATNMSTTYRTALWTKN